MTTEIKELIESVKVLEYPLSLSFQSRPMRLVEKSDFIRVVEELTKWNKVEDGTPDIYRQLLAKHSDGSVETAYYLDHKYRDCIFYSRCEPDIDFMLDDIVEWRYIY